MPDFLAGQTLTALHFPPTVSDTQNDQFQFDSTTFGIDADTGTYLDCAVVFMAGITGRVIVHYGADLDNSLTTASTNLAPVVREGGTIGAGASVVAADLANAIRNVGAEDRRYDSHLLVEGLTPGALYNVRLEHRVSAGTGVIQHRTVTVAPAT